MGNSLAPIVPVLWATAKCPTVGGVLLLPHHTKTYVLMINPNMEFIGTLQNSRVLAD